MRFDVFKWAESPAGDWTIGPVGRLRVKLSAPAALYVMAEGFEALAGFGTEFDLSISYPYAFKAEGPKGLRVFFEDVDMAAPESSGLVFTNAERLRHESGAMLAVQRALRMQKFAHMGLMRELRASTSAMRAERAALEEARKPEAKAEENPVVAGDEEEAAE